MKTANEQFRILRVTARHTQEDVAKMLWTTRRTIINIENGETPEHNVMPRLELYKYKLAEMEKE